MNTAFETSDVSNSQKKERYYVYVLFSQKDHGLYIGYTTDLKSRLTLHAKRQVTATKNRAPVLLIHYEYFINRIDAKAREKFLKSGYGREQMKNFIKRSLDKLVI